VPIEGVGINGHYQRVPPERTQVKPVSPLVRTSTILVVDDEPAVRTVVRRMLEELNYRVVEASNGEEGLRAAERIKRSLSLVVSDISMPVMDGIEFLDRFRPLYPQVPILFISGEGPTAVSRLAGVSEPLLFKPFGPDRLLEAVGRLLGSRLSGIRTPA
jgi:CheY-like chemotaxis protein